MWVEADNVACKDFVKSDRDLSHVRSLVMRFGKSYQLCRLKFDYATSWNLFRKQDYYMNKHCRVSASVQGQERLSHIDTMHSQFDLLVCLRGYIHFSYLHMRSHLFG